MRRWLLFAVAGLIALAAPAFGQRHGGGSHGGGSHSGGSHASGGSSGPTHVKGYTRKDGTHVRPHDRRRPNPAGGQAARSPAVRQTHYQSPRRIAQPTLTHHAASGYVGARAAGGRIQRSEVAKREFMKQTGFPHGRPGYVVDHIVPLAKGGRDDPGNMQWQTVAEAKAKDKWERK